MKRALVALLVVLWSAGGLARAQSIPAAVDTALSTPPFDAALWFVLVEDEQGNVVYERNSTKLAIPASVRKLFSSATVATCLDVESQLETQLWLDGEDVVIKGGGDPSFGSDRYGYEPESAAFFPFVKALHSRGIVRVRDVIADVSLFDRVTLPYQWKLGNIPYDTAAPVDALTWSENDLGSSAVASPGHFVANAFRVALEANGIAVTGTIRTETEPRMWAEHVETIRSPFVYDLLATVLKPSHNLFAETLLKRVSAFGEKPASYDVSREQEHAFLVNEVGLGDKTFRFVDGSGLAPDDLVTPAAIVKMLRWMNAPPRRGIYWNLLPGPGEREGTLRSRLVPLSDRLRAKTGTVAGVNSLAGIIAGRNGGYRYFAVIVNHHIGSGSVASRLIDNIVSAAAEF
ncbi:MAG: D-alanyl-D-alanine carboxypeptidase/D-alanyl-D-alanine-endopeptidase [Thermoanaerobaculia bacterium]